MEFWRRHKRKILFTSGVLGCGYGLYRLYDSYRWGSVEVVRQADLQLQAELQRQADELIRARLHIHIEDIQKTLEATILPPAMQLLRSRIAEELNISVMIDKLTEGKLQPREKRELWERLKYLSFTRTALSVWAMVTLFLYIRVQFNILGRHLYIETAHVMGAHEETEGTTTFDRRSQQEFLEAANYLSYYGLGSLILKMETVTFEVLENKRLVDPFSKTHVAQTVMQILSSFMNGGSPDHWTTYMIPENAAAYQQLLFMSSDGSENPEVLINTHILDELIIEARSVMSSIEFRSIMEIAMSNVMNGLTESLSAQLISTGPSALPLAKILPQVAGLGSAVLEETSNNKYIKNIRDLPEVKLFYANLFTDLSQPQHPEG